MNTLTVNQKVIEYHLGVSGRMVGGSKSIYLYDNPNNYVIFNANIFTKNGKIWHGDIDMTKDLQLLREASLDLKEPMYVLYEMDGRFENETNYDLDKALFTLDNGNVEIKSEYAQLKKGRITLKKLKIKFEKEKIQYHSEDFKETMKLPELKKLKVKLGYSVIEQFQKEIIKLNGLEFTQKHYLSMYVHKDYYNELEELIKKRILKAYPNLHPVKVIQSIAGEMLDGPMEFQSKPKWVKKNLGYIRSHK